jgi:outer membrane protein assembly factor BamE
MPNDIDMRTTCEIVRPCRFVAFVPNWPDSISIRLPRHQPSPSFMTLNPLRRTLMCLAPVLMLSACSINNFSLSKPETLFGLLEPYKVDVVQGNVVTQEVMAQIQPGLGRMQVKEILGTPLLADPFHIDRWDYVFTIRRQGVADQKRRVSIFFKNDAVERFDTEPLPTEHEFVSSIDKPVKGRDVANLTPEQIAALPLPPKADVARTVPQGAVRDYPPLEAGRR